MCFIYCYCIQFTTTGMCLHKTLLSNKVQLMYLQYTCIKVYIPFLGIQESFGEWIVFNFESSNLKQQIADVIQCHYAQYHCSFVDMLYKITL